MKKKQTKRRKHIDNEEFKVKHKKYRRNKKKVKEEMLLVKLLSQGKKE